jgi:hypothetical protein
MTDHDQGAPMSGQADYTEDEWTAIVEAPLEVMVTMFAAGQHGPISTIKESTAGAKAIAQPGNRGAASGLIAEVVPAAQGKQARHDAGHPHGASLAEIVDACLAKLEPAATALAAHPDEVDGFGSWLVDIAVAVARASKGVSDTERDAIDRIASRFGVAAPTI